MGQRRYCRRPCRMTADCCVTQPLSGATSYSSRTCGVREQRRDYLDHSLVLCHPDSRAVFQIMRATKSSSAPRTSASGYWDHLSPASNLWVTQSLKVRTGRRTGNLHSWSWLTRPAMSTTSSGRRGNLCVTQARTVRGSCSCCSSWGEDLGAE